MYNKAGKLHIMLIYILSDILGGGGHAGTACIAASATSKVIVVYLTQHCLTQRKNTASKWQLHSIYR